MADRLALLPLTGAGEKTCDGCISLYWDTPEGPPSCGHHLEIFHGHYDGSTVGRLPQCLSAERDAARLRKVEDHLDRLAEAAAAILTSSEVGHIIADDWRGVVALEALRAALKA